jgi:Protein of unknown function (DUF3613)
MACLNGLTARHMRDCRSFATPLVARFKAGTLVAFIAGSSLASSGVLAQTPAAGADHIDEPTLAWLELQRSGSASARAQTTLGVEATLAYQRYLDSFSHKIPAFFDTSIQSTTTSGGSGGASGGY